RARGAAPAPGRAAPRPATPTRAGRPGGGSGRRRSASCRNCTRPDADAAPYTDGGALAAPAGEGPHVRDAGQPAGAPAAGAGRGVVEAIDRSVYAVDPRLAAPLRPAGERRRRPDPGGARRAGPRAAAVPPPAAHRRLPPLAPPHRRQPPPRL